MHTKTERQEVTKRHRTNIDRDIHWGGDTGRTQTEKEQRASAGGIFSSVY